MRENPTTTETLFGGHGGGLRVRNNDAIEPRYKCNMCTYVLNRPVQLCCGHRYCEYCVKTKVQDGRVECNMCHKSTEESRMFVDCGFENDMGDMRVECALCEWSGEFRSYREHLGRDHGGAGTRMEMETSGNASGEVVALREEMRAVQKELQDMKKAVCLQNEDIIQQRTNLKIAEECMKEAKRKMEENAGGDTKDGTLIWKITDVARRMADAKNEMQTSIYSPPFYSSPSGYKMCARLYLSGDGSARRTHMSLFFVLMRGKHDAILKFPFGYKVTFCLFDQTGNQRHIIDSFRPDIKSTSFQRPTTDMNIASGIPKFVLQSMIAQDGNPYVKDDTMFIRISVQFDESLMPKMVLPYMMSLNPGLPVSVQENMVRDELKRCSQQQDVLISVAARVSGHE